ncbi:MAG: prephenate dehydratase [Alphaproteobacteria bacterium]|nr:prephenate dehydratase [Alphaproteobacteria bacterium]
MASDNGKTIAFQGAEGAYSDLACRTVHPDYTTMPCLSFDDVFAAVTEGRATLGMIAIENSIAGRVADVHHLLPHGQLHVVGEHYQPVVHHLLALPGTKLGDIKTAHSHVHALAQCRKFLRKHNIRPVIKGDTAGAASVLTDMNDKSASVIASELAGKIYGLESLAADIADERGNTTRFFIISREAKTPPPGNGPVITSIIFRVRSVPAALYKALGGFASNGINITKLESYLIDGRFTAAQFYIDFEGHPEDKPVRLALEELGFFASEIRLLGVYPAHKFRSEHP